MLHAFRASPTPTSRKSGPWSCRPTRCSASSASPPPTAIYSHAREPMGPHRLRLPPRLQAPHHQPRTPARRAHPLYLAWVASHINITASGADPEAISRPLPPLLRPTKPTSSRAGDGLTGSIHECMSMKRVPGTKQESRFQVVSRFKESIPCKTHACHDPPARPRPDFASAPYAANTTVWHHMSDALHQSLRPRSLLLIAIPGPYPGLHCRPGRLHPHRHGCLRALAPSAYRGQV